MSEAEGKAGRAPRSGRCGGFPSSVFQALLGGVAWGARRLSPGWVSVALFCCATGCSWPTANGRQHLVFGFGLVTTSTNRTNLRADPALGASVEQVRATGLLAGPGPVVNGLMLGHARRQTVSVPPDAELLIDARTSEAGDFQVDLISPQQHSIHQTNSTSPQTP